MELAFQKIDGQWVAEFEATSDFNINLDRVGKGALVIYQKGSKDGTYASQASYRNTKDSENIDADITALVYPKYIKVVSQTEVVKGIVTMDGEGGGSNSVVDNPDDYEQTLTLFVVNKDNSSQTFTLEEIVNPTGAAPLDGWEPTKMVITFYYLKNGVPIKFVPNDFKVRIKSEVSTSITTNAVYFEVVDGTIVIETPNWVWGVADSALVLWRKGELVFETIVNWT